MQSFWSNFLSRAEECNNFFSWSFQWIQSIAGKNKSAFWISEAFRLHQCQHLKPKENAFCWRKNTLEWMMKLSLTSRNGRQIILCPIEGLNSAFIVLVSVAVWWLGAALALSLFFSPSRACSFSLFPLYNVFCFHLNLPLCYRPNWLTLVDCPMSLYVFAVACVFLCVCDRSA